MLPIFFLLFLTPVRDAGAARQAASPLGTVLATREEDPSQRAALDLCLAPRRMPNDDGSVEEQNWDAGGTGFREISTGDMTDGCDVVVVFTRASTSHYDSNFRWQALSGHTKAALARGDCQNMWSINSMLKGVLSGLAARLEPGEALYAAAVAQREKARAAAAPAAAGGVSREEMKELVKEAVEGANSAKAPAPGPEPAAEKVSDVDAPSYPRAAPRPHDLAVVVGVEKYVDLPEAAFAERDARAVRAHLLALGYPERNVVLLTGERASRAGLVKNLETWLSQNAKEDSSVFFYYSGHGAPDVKTGEAYLVPRDGDPQFLEDTAYPLKRLYARLGALPAKRVIVAIDACFSGAGGRSVLPKGARPLVTQVRTAPVTGRVTALTASSASEISGVDEEQGHGLFTYYLLRGLNGAAKDGAGAVTVQSLYDYLVPNVQDEARRQNRSQTPQRLGADPGSLR